MAVGNNRLSFLHKSLSFIGKPFYWLSYAIIFFLAETPSFLQRIHILKIALLLAALSGALLLAVIMPILKSLPNPSRLLDRPTPLTTKIYDRNNVLLYKIYRSENRTLVPLEKIPKALVSATIAVEDDAFYNHQGISLKGIIRSVYKNLRGDRLYGGSTITQQLVKNTLLTPEKTIQRKIKEALLAIIVDAKYSKEEILQMYLNEVGYGGASYGVEEASLAYFGKSVTDLNLAESALLAGLPAAPTAYSPLGAHPEAAKKRQEVVLKRMKDLGYIDPSQEIEAKKKELIFKPQSNHLLAPHFVMYIKELLASKYGEKMLEEGGLEVRTSLDLKTQNMVQKIVANEINKLSNYSVTNGAAVVTNPTNGDILAMVGSKDYSDIKNDGNVNVVLSPRQPGSSIKPILYSLALENGFTAASIISDTPITYQVAGQPAYSPRNYDNRFHGNVSLRIALASSYNVPAVKIVSALGISKMIDRGKQLGITTWDDPSRFGLSLALGGGEVKMIDMAVAYGTLANLGKKTDLNPILEIKNAKGKTIETKDYYQESQALSREVAYIITDILSDNTAREPTFGRNSLLRIKDHPNVAVKTGTTQNLRDNWTIGYTQDFLVATWVGNNDNSAMSHIASGVTGASPIWNKIMTNLLSDIPDKTFPKPENIHEADICSYTGTLTCQNCPTKRELFIQGTEPRIHCQIKKEEEKV